MLYSLIIILPLSSVLLSFFFSDFLGLKGVQFITSFFLFISFCISLVIFYEVGICGSFYYIQFFSWFKLGFFTVSWGCFFDSLTSIMLLLITFVSFLVHIYSISYMEEDPHNIRFFIYLSFFTFFMILLVVSDNFLQLFVGWEGVGLCSYLLINFWHTRIQANKAAMKAMLVNRVGDFGLALGILLIFYLFKTLDFSIIFTMCPVFISYTINIFGFCFNCLNLISFFLFIGAMGKSAQLGLHVWLPDAMEGPTPVSALIHAATMVTAGVFLVARCSHIFEYSPTVLIFISVLGGMTALFGASVALFQNDIKKIIAYSTTSQLGYMFLICGISQYNVGVFHLFNHGFFKALLFLVAGGIIHSMSDEQDIRRMGGLRKILPFCYAMMLIGSLSLGGFPFLTGYYSKDLILECAYSKYTFLGFFLYGLGLLTAILTVIYSVKLIYFVFYTRTNAFYRVMIKVHEVSNFILYALTLLALGSIFIGYLFKDLFVGIGTPFWGNSIFILPQNYLVDYEFLSAKIKLLPTILTTMAGFITYYLLRNKFNFLFNYKLKFKNVYIFFNKKWFFDSFFIFFIVKNFLQICYIDFYKNIDKGFLEAYGPKGFSYSADVMSDLFNNANGAFFLNFSFYFLIFIFSFVIFITFTYYNILFVIFLFLILWVI